MNYTYTLDGTADEKRQGRVTLRVIDLTYNLSWNTLVTAFSFLEQNPQLKSENLEKEKVINLFYDFVYDCFTQQKGTRLLIETSGTQQLTFKCSQDSTDLLYSCTLSFETYNNLVSLVEDVKEAFQKKLGPVLEKLDALAGRVATLETTFSRMVVEQVQSVPLDVSGRPEINASGNVSESVVESVVENVVENAESVSGSAAS
jgi:hypothetical protein